MCIIFLIINIYICCTRDKKNSTSNQDLGSIRTNTVDLDAISIKSGASTRPPSRLSSKSGSVILVTKIGDEDRIEVIEEVDEETAITDLI